MGAPHVLPDLSERPAVPALLDSTIDHFLRVRGPSHSTTFASDQLVVGQYSPHPALRFHDAPGECAYGWGLPVECLAVVLRDDLCLGRALNAVEKVVLRMRVDPSVAETGSLIGSGGAAQRVEDA